MNAALLKPQVDDKDPNDFPDIDGDGDTKEPNTRSPKDKKEKEGGKDEVPKDYSKQKLQW